MYDQAEKYEGAYRASMAQKFDEGKVEGKVEGINEVAKNLLLEGVKIETIIKTTGLSNDAIQLIQKNLTNL